MAMFYGPRAGQRLWDEQQEQRGLPVDPPPSEVAAVDALPWIEASLPPDNATAPVWEAPVVVIEPVEKPPWIAPPVPDLVPATIVPFMYEESIPEPLPLPPRGALPTVRPPPTLALVSGAAAFGTFMVYVGRKLVLTMAASLGTSLGKSAGAMLVGAVNKQLFRGTTIRFHTGQSFGLGFHGDYGDDPARPKGVSYEQAWRMVPQEFSYWEA